METPVYYRVPDPRMPNAAPLMLTFREDTELNAEASKEAGFEVFDTVLTALVSPAGQVKSNVSRIVRRVLPDGTKKDDPFYARMYAEQLRAHDAGDETGGTGTKLADLPGLNSGLVRTLKARGVFSIEALAELPDVSGTDLMGFRKWQALAVAWLQSRKEAAPLVKMNEALAERDARLASQQRQLDEMKELLANLGEEKRGPGRPRKEAA